MDYNLATVLTRSTLSNGTTARKVGPALEKACDRFDIMTPRRIAGFLSQCSYESMRFTRTTESMRYSASRLLQVFPKYFSESEAETYARKERAIANRVYGGRMGNFGLDDGWNFRGRGYIQLTGRVNYTKFAAAGFPKVLEDPSIVATPEYAALSAAWYWATHGCNELADKQDIKRLTKTINGGYHGLEQREKLYWQAIKAV